MFLNEFAIYNSSSRRMAPGKVRRPLLLALLCCALSGTSNLMAQQVYPTDYFRSPVDFRMFLSGTFGEIRTNHLHSGMDVRTNGAEGAKIYAVADGYVSRINVSAYGFGKALYITHPNGYTSVYAHLNYFTGQIHEYVMKEHYRRESFEMTLYPEPGELRVTKGQVVAYSGNSGTSGGPHLHFEIRDEATQDPINPLLFGMEVKDLVPPRLTWLKIYAADAGSRINGKSADAKFQVEGSGKGHTLSGSPAITLSGNIAFGIQCHDVQSDSDNKNGIYSVSFFVDQAPVASFRIETFAFSETRYVNSLIDYNEYIRSGMRFLRTEIDPGNKLPVYAPGSARGIFTIDDEQLHQARCEVADAAGNISVLTFSFRGQRAMDVKTAEVWDMEDPSVFIWNRDNKLKTNDFILEAPAGSFYRTFRMNYSASQACKGCYSPVHHVHDRYTPVHDHITLAIRPAGLPERLQAKALLVRIDDNTGGFVTHGGAWEEDGFVRTTVREFGNYAVAVDTISPSVAAIDAAYHKNLAGRTTLKFTIKDQLSGIKSYRGTLNGQWILMDFDAKNDLLVYYIGEQMKPGTNAFRLVVTDMKDNQRVFETTMVR